MLDATPDGDIGDAAAALDFLTQQPDVVPHGIGVVGLSWGGVIAACLAGRDRRIRSTVLWETPANVSDWDPPYRETPLGEVADFWGNVVGRGFFGGLSIIHPTQEIKRAHGPVLGIYAASPDALPFANAELYRQALCEGGVTHEFVTIAEADHGFTRYEWERDVIAHTVAWLQRTLTGER
jgi:dienelactone hydrolase